MLAKITTKLIGPMAEFLPENIPLRMTNAYCEVVASSGLTHRRPEFNIHSVLDSKLNREVEVIEEVIEKTAFCTLLRFKKDLATTQPRVLVIAPMSGHFATLLRPTVLTLLGDHDVYITDWHNVRDIPQADGLFDLDVYIQHIIHFLETIGAGTHLLAVCQPCVPALAAVALMAQDKNHCQPPTMTLMAGPVDTRISPTVVNNLATTKPIEWFERNVINTVPMQFKGRMRRVYPGFLQISAFMSMNLPRHIGSFLDLYGHVFANEKMEAKVLKDFYHEYFSMMDLPAEYYLQTIKSVFQDFALAKGEMRVNGRLVEPAAIHRTALFTIEGERDDICSLGQTMAAQTLCPSLPPFKKQHHVQPGVGHYGVFGGRRWEFQVYPRVRHFIYAYS